MKKAVCIVIFNENHEVLSISRRGNPNQYGIIGGKVDDGETNIEAIIRETYEETGICLDESCIDEVFKTWVGDFLVTTFTALLFCDETHLLLPRKDSELNLKFLKISQLMDEKISPFFEYNRKLFEGLQM